MHNIPQKPKSNSYENGSSGSRKKRRTKKSSADNAAQDEDRKSSLNINGKEEEREGVELDKTFNGIAGGFGTQDDFISFGPASDVEEDNVQRGLKRETKQNIQNPRDRERTPQYDDARPKEDTPPRATEREWDKGKRRDEEPNDGGRRRRDEDRGESSSSHRKRGQPSSLRQTPWTTNVDWERCHNVAELLHLEVEAFVDYISPTPEEDEIRGLIVSIITRVVTNAFPDATVYPFGSFATKLYLPLGDLDLVILSNSMAHNDKHTVLRSLANALRRSGITEKVTIIAKAKVPIVKFITIHGRFNVDISINQPNGIAAVSLIAGFLSDMHLSGRGKALKSLVMITKAFLSQRGMNEVYTGGLGSYSIVCLAVSFLQMHPKIRKGEIGGERNLGVLLMEFFELYGCYFNYDEVGVSVRDGGTYFNKRQRGWQDAYKSHLLSIEDPIDPGNDISKSSYGIGKVRATFAGAYGILTSTAYLRAGMINSRRDEERSFRFQDYARSPDEMSILSSIMGITQETIRHRKMLREIYDGGLLHHICGVKPRVLTGPRVVEKRCGNPSPAAESVERAWNEAETNRSKPESKRSREENVEEEEGRYHIGSSTKKRKARSPTYISVDDDEEAMVFSDSSEEVSLKVRTSSSSRNRSH